MDRTFAKPFDFSRTHFAVGCTVTHLHVNDWCMDVGQYESINIQMFLHILSRAFTAFESKPKWHLTIPTTSVRMVAKHVGNRSSVVIVHELVIIPQLSLAYPYHCRHCHPALPCDTLNPSASRPQLQKSMSSDSGMQFEQSGCPCLVCCSSLVGYHWWRTFLKYLDFGIPTSLKHYQPVECLPGWLLHAIYNHLDY